MTFASSFSTIVLLSGMICIATDYNSYGQIKLDSVNYGNTVSSEMGGSDRAFRYSFNTASPQAQKLMKEDFFWSPIEETAPFGSDDGSDAAYGFYQWRPDHKQTDPMNYLNELFARWDYLFFDRNELDSIKIKKYITTDVVFDDSTIASMKQTLKDVSRSAQEEMSDYQINQSIKESSKNMGITFLTGQDAAIIGTGFAQLVLEGRISPDLKRLTAIAIERQLLPVLLTRYPVDYQKTRKDQLTKMLYVINNCN